MIPHTEENETRRKKAITIIAKGIGRLSREEMKRREENDMEPHFLQFEDTIDSDILDEKYLRRAPLHRRILYELIPTTLAQVLEAFFVRKRYDVVISWSAQNALPYALLSKLMGKQYPHIALLSWLSQPKKKLLLRFVQSHIDRIVVWSSNQRDIAVKETNIPQSKISLVSRRADTRFWRPTRTATDRICSVGQEMRDFPTLINALDGINIPCHIATGEFYSKLHSSVKEVDTFTQLPSNFTVRKLNNFELRALYARSRFVVIPLHQSDTDNGVTTIEESMAMGKAVICSRTKGQIDIIQEGKTGLFVPVGDPDALRKAILYLWENPRIAEEMGRYGREYIEQFHSLDKFVGDVNSIIDEVLHENKVRDEVPVSHTLSDTQLVTKRTTVPAESVKQ